jgi:hypothetical protein
VSRSNRGEDRPWSNAHTRGRRAERGRDASSQGHDDHDSGSRYRRHQQSRRAHAVDYRRRHDPIETFRCRHCRLIVGPAPWGGPNGGHRNHCPYCLHSRHVDGKTPGDRASACGASMAPVGVFARGKGEHVIVHRCLGCGFERHCRVAADDDFEAMLALPAVKPRVKK